MFSTDESAIGGAPSEYVDDDNDPDIQFPDLGDQAGDRYGDDEEQEDGGDGDKDSEAGGAGGDASASSGAVKPISEMSVEEILALRPDLKGASPSASTDNTPKDDLPDEDTIVESVISKYKEQLNEAVLDPEAQIRLQNKINSEIASFKYGVAAERDRRAFIAGAHADKPKCIERIVAATGVDDAEIKQEIQGMLGEIDPVALAYIEQDKQQLRRLDLITKGLLSEKRAKTAEREAPTTGPSGEGNRVVTRSVKLSGAEERLIRTAKLANPNLSDKQAIELVRKRS